MSDSYSQDDVQQILQRAIVRQTHSEEFSRQQLVEIAQELGIPSTDLQLAEQEWLVTRQLDQEQLEFQRYQRSRFRAHLIQFSIINTFLLALDWLITPGLSWSLIVLLGWGLGVTLDGWKAFQSEGELFERGFLKWRKRQQFKQLRQEVGQTVTHLLRKGMRELQR